jgi:hypothetical protein
MLSSREITLSFVEHTPFRRKGMSQNGSGLVAEQGSAYRRAYLGRAAYPDGLRFQPR